MLAYVFLRDPSQCQKKEIGKMSNETETEKEDKQLQKALLIRLIA